MNQIKLELTPDAHERLEELKKMTGAENFGEILRRALLLFDWYTHYQQQGYKLQLYKPDGQVLEMINLEMVK